jgi:hypothetical protein
MEPGAGERRVTILGGLLAALTDPLGYAFMRNGLVAVVLLGVACGLVGVFVVHQRLTFFAHALSHTVFPALVVATALRADLTLGAIVGTAATVALVLALRAQRDVGDDSAVGIVFIGLLALGVVLVGLLRIRAQVVADVLVGNVLGISPLDLVLSGALVALIGLVVLALYRPLVLVAFDHGRVALADRHVAELIGNVLGHAREPRPDDPSTEEQTSARPTASTRATSTRTGRLRAHGAPARRPRRLPARRLPAPCPRRPRRRARPGRWRRQPGRLHARPCLRRACGRPPPRRRLRPRGGAAWRPRRLPGGRAPPPPARRPLRRPRTGRAGLTARMSAAVAPRASAAECVDARGATWPRGR